MSLQINLNDYLGPEALCKKVEDLVWGLDTTAIERTYSPYGQSGYHPKTLLSIIFYGYMEGLRSGRKLSKVCKENLAFIYLSDGCQIGKSTFNDFRKNHHEHFAGLFDQVVQKSIELGLCDASTSIVDGSKLRANCSKRRTKTSEQYKKWEALLKADIEELEGECASKENTQEISSQLSSKKNF